MTKERPILFSGPMVRAIIENKKTQTRRIYKCKEPVIEIGEHCFSDAPCPYGRPGDCLWVRETWCYDTIDGYYYRADTPGMEDYDPTEWKWKPSIFMPRLASRILLEIVAVRVERLQDISEEDARAEGCEAEFEMNAADFINGKKLIESTYKIGYKHLWQSINGPGSWDENPFVWVVEFRRITNA